MGNGVFRYSYRSRILKADLVRDSDEKQYFISYQNVLIPSPDVFVKYVCRLPRRNRLEYDL